MRQGGLNTLETTFRILLALAVIGYGISESVLRPHRYTSGLLFIGLGLCAVWRTWRLRKYPTLWPTQSFTFSKLLFWVAVLFAGVLLYLAVRAR